MYKVKTFESDEWRNRLTSGYGALQDMYCLDNEVKRNLLECEDDIEKYLFENSVIIEWDRRTTVRIDVVLGRNRHDEDRILWGRHVGNDDVESEPKIYM